MSLIILSMYIGAHCINNLISKLLKKMLHTINFDIFFCRLGFISHPGSVKRLMPFNILADLCPLPCCKVNHLKPWIKNTLSVLKTNINNDTMKMILTLQGEFCFLRHYHFLLPSPKERHTFFL